MKKILIIMILSAAFASGFAQNPVYPAGLKQGDKAPTFTAMDNQGSTINLQESLQKGSVVIIFYRGQWCPFCNKELGQLNDSLSLITDKGATVIAVTPETMDNVSKTVEKTKASFPIISDSSLAIMKLYKVNYAVDKGTQDKYKTYGIDFMQANGSNGANLPVPASYVIGKDGIIKYVFFNPDYRVRGSVKELLAHL